MLSLSYDLESGFFSGSLISYVFNVNGVGCYYFVLVRTPALPITAHALPHLPDVDGCAFVDLGEKLKRVFLFDAHSIRECHCEFPLGR